MVAEGKSVSTPKYQENLMKRLHIMTFFILLFLLISQILLLRVRLSSIFCVVFLSILLILNVTFYYLRRQRYRSTRKEVQRQHDAKYGTVDLPRVYEFFCPRCLYQTNEDVELCPNCKVGRLAPTTKDPEKIPKLQEGQIPKHGEN